LAAAHSIEMAHRVLRALTITSCKEHCHKTSLANVCTRRNLTSYNTECISYMSLTVNVNTLLNVFGKTAVFWEIIKRRDS
jgi:hypothetical protein